MDRGLKEKKIGSIDLMLYFLSDIGILSGPWGPWYIFDIYDMIFYWYFHEDEVTDKFLGPESW